MKYNTEFSIQLIPHGVVNPIISYGLRDEDKNLVLCEIRFLGAGIVKNTDEIFVQEIELDDLMVQGKYYLIKKIQWERTKMEVIMI